MSLIDREALIAEYDRVHVGAPGGARKLMVDAPEVRPEPKWIPVSERLPEYMEPVLTWDGRTYCVEKRIPVIRDNDTDEGIPGEWWVSDDYDWYDSNYYPNLRDGACIAWMPLPKPYREE